MGESIEQIGEYIEQILVYGALELFRFQNKQHIGIVWNIGNPFRQL